MFCTHQPADDEPLSFEKYTIRQKIHFEKYTLEKYAVKNTIKITLASLETDVVLYTNWLLIWAAYIYFLLSSLTIRQC